MPAACVGALPRRLWQWTEACGEVLPAWLTARDGPWLRDLLEEARAADGEPLGRLVQRWRQTAADPRAGDGLAMARHALLALLRRAAPRPVLPGRARRHLFAALAGGLPGLLALRRTAAHLGLHPEALRERLFADLPLERAVRCPPIDHAWLALAVNRALAQGILTTAATATLRLRGAARAVLRTAWLHGTGLAVEACDDQGVRLHWRADGTARGGRALAAILPVLPWSRRFELRAECRPADRPLRLVLGNTDPLLPGPEPRPFDSALERGFARSFARLAPGWRLLREPAPAAVGDQLVFPDFELCRPRDGATWLLEITGLRRAEALPGKLRALAALPRLVLCLPQRAVSGPLAAHPRVIAFARTLDAGCVLQRIERLSHG